jgi:PleD family two-component response regulator
MTTIDRADLKVLIVDDQEISRDLVRENLRVMGFTDIHMAETSDEGTEKISTHAYDIVFLDWMMPGKSGFLMLKDYRQNRSFDHVAFVMVTSQANEKLMAEALKAGATAYVIKPAMPSIFRPNVETVLEWVLKFNPRFRFLRK